jgi:hypothetical protein
MWKEESISNLSTNLIGSIRVIKPEEMNKYGVTEKAVASAKKSLMPESFDAEKNIDVLPVVFNLAVVNKFNQNDDGIKTSVAMDLVKQFVNKPINIEHMKDKIVGHIINASFSDKQPEYEDNEIEAYKDRKDPFYITAAGIIYRHIFPSLSEKLIQASDPDNENYQSLSTSWEVGFRNYALAFGEGSMHEVEEMEEEDENYSSLKGNLKAYGGTGYSNKGRVRRIINGPAYALGVGITETPAAEVKGLYVLIEEEEYEEEENEEEEMDKKNEMEEENDKLFSQEYKKSVKANKSSFSMNEQQFNQLMAKLQEGKASSEIALQIKKVFDEQNEWKSQADANKKDLEKALAELDLVKTEFEKTNLELGSIKEEIEAKAAADLFNARVKAILDKYELTEAQEKIVIEDVKNLDSSEASFENFKTRAEVLFAKQNKEAIASLEEAKKAEIEKAAEQLLESKASKEDEVETEFELEVEEIEASNLPNNTAGHASEETLLQKIKKNGLQFQTA